MGNSIADFMAKPAGRATRIILGLAVVGVGLSLGNSAARTTVVLIGLVPILAGSLNFCGIAPLLGEPFAGKSVLKKRDA